MIEQKEFNVHFQTATMNSLMKSPTRFSDISDDTVAPELDKVKYRNLLKKTN